MTEVAVAQGGESQPTGPSCPACDQGGGKPVPSDLSPGVEYFRCERCGFIWATRQ